MHAYCAANEPYSNWEGLNRKSEEYKRLKVPSIHSLPSNLASALKIKVEFSLKRKMHRAPNTIYILTASSRAMLSGIRSIEGSLQAVLEGKVPYFTFLALRNILSIIVAFVHI